jgi:hypothetical protein
MNPWTPTKRNEMEFELLPKYEDSDAKKSDTEGLEYACD